MHTSKWKWKHDNPKPMGFNKCSTRGRIIAIQAYLKKQEWNQINNLNLNLKLTVGCENVYCCSLASGKWTTELVSKYLEYREKRFNSEPVF